MIDFGYVLGLVGGVAPRAGAADKTLMVTGKAPIGSQSSGLWCGASSPGVDRLIEERAHVLASHAQSQTRPGQETLTV